MDDIERSPQEEFYDLSHLTEDFPQNLANGDNNRFISNKITAYEAEISQMDAGTMDKAPVSLTAYEAPLQSPENLALNFSTNSEPVPPHNGSQYVVNEDFGLSIDTEQSTEDLFSQVTKIESSKIGNTESGPYEAAVVSNESTMQPNQLVDIQAINSLGKFEDSKLLDFEFGLPGFQGKGASPEEDEDRSKFLYSNADQIDLPTVTTDKSNVCNNQDSEGNAIAKAGFAQSAESNDNEEGQEFDLEEFTVPLETMSKDEGLAKTVSSTHGVCAQVHEITEAVFPASIYNPKNETCNSTQATAIHQAAKLQTAAGHSEVVEFSPIKHGDAKSTVCKIDQAPVQGLMLAKLQPPETFEKILEMKSEKGAFIELSKNFTESNKEIRNLQSTEDEKLSDGFAHDKENLVFPRAETNRYNMPRANGTTYIAKEIESHILDEELDFDTKYALFVKNILPGHEIYYLPPSKSKKGVNFIHGGTLDQRRTVSGSPLLWNPSVNAMRIKSATLEAPFRRRLQPKPSVNDDHLFPNSVTPSKVEKAIGDYASGFNKERSQYDVPFMDDDAFVPKKFCSLTTTYNDSSDDSAYSNENVDLLEVEHLAKMDETSSQIGLKTIGGKHEGGSRWVLSSSFCGCLRRHR